MLTLTLATKNLNKLTELERIIAEQQQPIHIKINPSVGDVDETGTTFLANATLKAQKTPPTPDSQLILGEDSGMIIPALDGQFGYHPFPGIHSNRWMSEVIRKHLLGKNPSMPITQEERNEGILALMRDIDDRRAQYVCAMAAYDPKKNKVISSEGTTDLWINRHPQGQNGFGYDPITLSLEVLKPGESPDTAPTMAELSTSQKNAISHRGRAFQSLLKRLGEEGYL